MHIPIVVSLLVILVAMVPAVGVSLIATRGRKSSGRNEMRPTKPMSAPTGNLKLDSRPVRQVRKTHPCGSSSGVGPKAWTTSTLSTR